jgi:rhodanese-related sulfurtransferase
MNLSQEDWVLNLKEMQRGNLDVRTEDEYNDGIISNAINIDIRDRFYF